MAFAAVWLLSNWRWAMIWAITVGMLVFTQGYFTYVMLAANMPAATSL